MKGGADLAYENSIVQEYFHSDLLCLRCIYLKGKIYHRDEIQDGSDRSSYIEWQEFIKKKSLIEPSVLMSLRGRARTWKYLETTNRLYIVRCSKEKLVRDLYIYPIEGDEQAPTSRVIRAIAGFAKTECDGYDYI